MGVGRCVVKWKDEGLRRIFGVREDGDPETCTKRDMDVSGSVYGGDSELTSEEVPEPTPC